jgi:lipid-binding SYLF domain-containing protein
MPAWPPDRSGRNAAAATDGQLKAEIWSWSRARGLFAGIALDGAVLSIDNGANRSTYGNAVTPRAVFEGRAPQAPSAAIVAVPRCAGGSHRLGAPGARRHAGVR